MIDKLKPIAIEYLQDGMVLLHDIYNYNGKVILLRTGETISATNIRQLRNINENNRNVTVIEETYKLLMKNQILTDEIKQRYLEDTVGYGQIKEATSSFLNIVQTTNKIDCKESKLIAENVQQKLEESDSAIIFECLNAPRPLDEDLQRHCVNVSIMNGLLGGWMELSKSKIEKLVLAGLVHDVGKTKVPVEILEAPRRLTPEEFEIIKKHPAYSEELLLEENSFDEEVRMAARHHHERITGGGYPDNISGEQISLFARITAISDIYDAMVSRRSYKESSDPFSIMNQFANNEFEGIDLEILAVFLKNMPRAFIGKSVLMSDGTIGTIKYIMPNDLKYPIIDIDGIMKQASETWLCVQIIHSI